ncbi:MAG TPA: hypothetical protein VNZ45_06385, partial [Bacteroidia bacterium]|nr:hypothetical protein [Bacteroidia bacterium]
SASVVPSSAVNPSPCTQTQSVNSIKSTKTKNTLKKRPTIGGGFLQQFIQILIQLIMQLLQRLGIQVPTLPGQTGNPCPTPAVGSGAPSTQPSLELPTSGIVPTTSQPTSGAGPTATPVSSSSCTKPQYTIQMDPNNAQNGVTIGNFYLSADTWNAANYQVSQTVYACNYNNWYVVANMNNNNGDGAVKTSPNIHEDFNEKPISSFNTITSSFAESGPHVGIYEFEYDMWLNGVASNGSTEIMLWNDNFGQTPSGSIVATFSDGGQTYNVWKSGSYIAFVDKTNVTSGTINILDFYNYVIKQGWIPSTSTIGQIDYGMELVSTNGTNQTFKVTNFSLTAN